VKTTTVGGVEYECHDDWEPESHGVGLRSKGRRSGSNWEVVIVFVNGAWIGWWYGYGDVHLSELEAVMLMRVSPGEAKELLRARAERAGR